MPCTFPTQPHMCVCVCVRFRNYIYMSTEPNAVFFRRNRLGKWTQKMQEIAYDVDCVACIYPSHPSILHPFGIFGSLRSSLNSSIHTHSLAVAYQAQQTAAAHGIIYSRYCGLRPAHVAQSWIFGFAWLPSSVC